MKIAKLNIEGYIGGADIMSMFSGEETFNLSKLKKFLDSLESDVTDIHVYINSGGGSVTEGWSIYDQLKTSGKTITTIGEGIVGSIATVIYMAGSVRKLHENSKFFIHNPYWMPNEASPMEGNDLIALGEDLKNEQAKILDFYSKITGTSLDTIEPLMNKATDLTSIQAIEMGFAHSVINEFVNQNHYKLVAMIDIKDKPNKNEKMSKVEETVLNKMNKFFKNFSRVTKGKFYDMDIAVTDEAGNAVNLVIESDTEDLTGASCKIVDADGNESEAKDGNYVDAEGKTIKVVAGKVSEVVAKVTDNTEPTIEDLKAQLEAANNENASLKANVQAAKEENETIKANITIIEKEFVALKAVVIGEGAEFDLGTQTFKANKQSIAVNPNESYLNEMTGMLKKK